MLKSLAMKDQHHGEPGLLARAWHRIVHAFASSPKQSDDIPGDGANTTLFGGLPCEIGDVESTVVKGDFWDSRDDSSVFPDWGRDQTTRRQR